MSRKTRKLMWSVPLIAAVAVIGALAAFMTLQPNDAAAQTLQTPGAVQNFALESTGPTSIKLTWDAPTEGGRQTGYRIDVSDDGYTWELLSESVPGQDDEYDHTGLMARQTKYYRIFAHNQGGAQISPVAMPSPMSAMTMASTRPMSPDNLTAEAGTPAQEEITVTWEPPDTPPGTTIHQYKVAYAQNPGNLSLSQSRTLEVSPVPVDLDDDEKVYCGANGDSCSNTFTGLLEHETWHFQVYAVNMDAMGDVGTSNPSDTTSLATADGLLSAAPADLWAAVNKNSPGVWLYWTPPDDPDGAPVTDYLIQGRPITSNSTEDTTDNNPTDTVWGNKPGNVVVFHNRTTADLLLTNAELRGAALAAWQADDRNDSVAATADVNDGNLDNVPNFDAYFSNLEWEFRVFALNSVWKREVQSNPTKLTATLGQDSPATTTSAALAVTAGDGAEVNNLSQSLRVSLNELYETRDSDLAADPPDPRGNDGLADGVGPIAPIGVNLQQRIARVTATKDDQTNGGRTKIDLSWKRTYSHTQLFVDANNDGVYDSGDTQEVFTYNGQRFTTAGGTHTPLPAGTDVVTQYHYAEQYRVQWSTDPDASDWNLLDQTPAPGNTTHDDFTAAEAMCDADDTCTVSHTGRTAGQEYTYRVFAMNEEDGTGVTNIEDDTTTTGTVFSWWQRGSATTSQAEKPGRPTSLMASKSFSNGHTEIDLEWQAPAMDHDGGGTGLGYGSLVKYVIEKSDDGGNTWTELVRPKADLKKTTYTHKGLEPGQTVRYRVATVNEGPREKMSDWSDTATQTTEKSTKPDKPEGLVAEAMGPNAIKLCWNIQSRTPPAAPILAYIIEYEDDGEWMELARITYDDAADNYDDDMDMTVRTMYTDYGLEPETTRKYRVRAENMPEIGMLVKSEESEHAEATTDAAMAPGMPTALTATPVGSTQIDLEWMAPADNGGAEVGYVLERKMGDGEFMTIAATDAAAWWNALDCPMMNAAVPADSTPAPGSDDPDADPRSPYCELYADLAEDAMMVVSQAFTDSGYATITGTSHMDMGLTEQTMYTYRVTAVNVAGASMPSAEESATTGPPPSLTAPMLTATPGAGSVTLTWDEQASAMDYTVAAIKEDLSSGFYWMTDITGTTHTVPNLDSGDAYYFVVAACEDAGCATYLWSNIVTETPN